mgnify:CR=1 FL=1|tara:strand:- start:785 stop:988 length:204 start_codon:yes stop_codon:yes gene_type:complete
MTTPTERNYLLRCLVGLLATGIVIGAVDLAACRVRTPANCDPQSSAVFAAVGAAAGWIGGILTKSPP